MNFLPGRSRRRGVIRLALGCALASPLALAQTPRLDPADLRAINVEVSAATYRGRVATRVIERYASPKVAGGEALAIIPGTDFVNGTIELDLASRLAPGASDTARGFVGLAFDVTEGGSRFKSFYLRPTNGRAPDQLRRNHSTQYTAAISYLAAIAAARALGPKLSSFIGLTEVLFAAFFAWLFVGEAPTAAQLGGGALIIGGVVLVHLDEMRSPGREGGQDKPSRVEPAETEDGRLAA